VSGPGAVLVDAVGIRPLFWFDGSLLALSGVLGLGLLGGHDFRRERGRPDG